MRMSVYFSKVHSTNVSNMSFYFLVCLTILQEIDTVYPVALLVLKVHIMVKKDLALPIWSSPTFHGPPGKHHTTRSVNQPINALQNQWFR